jgi:thioredoxin reductase (NADPH)
MALKLPDSTALPQGPSLERRTITGANPVSEIRDVIIIGSGPAGYTAALYTARANMRPLVFEGFQFGGALMQTTEVENYPGFPDGIMGPELMDQWRKQAERFGAELVSDDVTRVDLAGEIKKVWVGDDEYLAKAVILATGSAYRPLNVPGENELMGRGVSACATCDGFFFRDQHIAVVGGGDSAMEEATFLTKFASKVTIVHRRDEFRASKIMAERALANPKIEVAWNSAVTEIKGEGGKVSSVDLIDTVTGETRELPVTGLFIAIGHDPRSELFKGQVELDESGYVKVAAPSTRTNMEGVFAAGDLVDHTYQQAVTAAGTGCAAALDAERYIAALND